MRLTARAFKDGITVRVWQGSDIRNDELLMRIDILYGYAVLQRPEWASASTALIPKPPSGASRAPFFRRLDYWRLTNGLITAARMARSLVVRRLTDSRFTARDPIVRPSVTQQATARPRRCADLNRLEAALVNLGLIAVTDAGLSASLDRGRLPTSLSLVPT